MQQATDPGAGPRNEMVALLRRRGELSDDRVAAAFSAVQRHLFLPGVDLKEAYADRAVPTHFRGGVATSAASQPAIVAIMLEALRPPTGGSVLEIGAGTGYNAALLSFLVGRAGRVVSVDIDEDVVDEARRHLQLAGVRNVEVLCGDGADGWPGGAPYDGIIVTAGASDLAPGWIEQLAPDGRLVVPLSLSGVQQCVAFTRTDGHLRSVQVCECGFMPLVGSMANTDRRLGVPRHGGVFVEVASGVELDVEAVASALEGGGTLLETGLHASPEEIFGSFRRWLAISDAAAALLSYVGAPAGAQASGVPAVLEFSGPIALHRSSPCLLGTNGLAVLDLVSAAGDAGPPGGGIDLGVRILGAAVREGERLVSLLHSWDEAGRPRVSRLSIDAYPAGAVVPGIEGSVHTARHMTFVVRSG